MNWDKRISRAKKRGNFTDKDKSDAFDWEVCSLGEYTNGETGKYKITGDAVWLGNEFTQAVISDEMEDAKDAHDYIKKMPKRFIFQVDDKQQLIPRIK